MNAKTMTYFISLYQIWQLNFEALIFIHTLHYLTFQQLPHMAANDEFTLTEKTEL